MNECPFCELLWSKSRNLALNSTLWFAFTPIGPINDGHVLLVPKRHVARLEDLSESEWKYLRAELFSLVTEDYNIGVNAGEVAGQTVFHLHIHIIPRIAGDVENVKGGIVGALGEKMKGSQMWEYLKDE